jgi:hypothetical protein
MFTSGRRQSSLGYGHSFIQSLHKISCLAVSALADPTKQKVPVSETLDGLTVLWGPGPATVHPAPCCPGTRVRGPC